MFGYSPNMEGRIAGIQGTSAPSANGPFKYLNGGSCYGTDPGNWRYGTFSFDPSTVSTQYVTGAVLQPSALQVLACIKV